MAELVIVRWRAIPAQVLVRAGRRTARRQLSDRFQEAIDRAAMRAKLTGTDAYLGEWARDPPLPCGEDLEAEAQAAADRLEAAYDATALRALVAALGNEPDPEAEHR